MYNLNRSLSLCIYSTVELSQKLGFHLVLKSFGRPITSLSKANTPMNPQYRTITLLIITLFLVVSCASTEPTINVPVTAPTSLAEPTQVLEEATSIPTEIPTTTPLPDTLTPTNTPYVLSSLAFAPENDSRINLQTTLGNSSIGIIQDLAWRPGSNEVVIIGDLSVVLLDTDTWELIWESPYRSDHPKLMLSADGSLLAIMDGMGYVSFVDAKRGRPLEELPVEGNFTISPDGRLVASTVGGHIHLLDWEQGQEIGLLQAASDLGAIYDMAFSANGKTLIAGTDTGDVQVWDVDTLRRLYTIPAEIPSEIYACEVNGTMFGEPIGNLVLNCSYPSENYQTTYYKIQLWEANRQSQFTISKSLTEGGYYDITINPARSKLALSSKSGVEIWRANGSSDQILEIVETNGLAFHPELENLLAVWGDRFIQLWDLQAGILTDEFIDPGSVASVDRLVFSPKLPGRTLAVGRRDGVVELWDVATQKKQYILPESPSSITGMAFSPDGDQLVISNSSGELSVWDTVEDPVLSFTLISEPGIAELVLFEEKNGVFTGGNTGLVDQWDLANQKRIHQWDTGSQAITALAISPDEQVLAAGDNSGKIQLWDINEREILHTFNLGTGNPVDSIAFNPDGVQLVATSENSIQAWDVASGTWVRAWKAQDTHNRLLYSPDQCILALGSGESVDFLDLRKGSFYPGFGNAKSSVTSLAFSSDGYLMAIGSKNGNVLIWGVQGALDEPDQLEPPPIRCPSIEVLPTPTATEVPTNTPVPSATPLMTPTYTPTPPLFERSLYLDSPLMQGNDVHMLQERLVELGYEEVGVPDGFFGEKTDLAVRYFQEINMLAVDGIVGPKTWEAMFSPRAIPAP